MILTSPLKVQVSRQKFFILNINNYRNTYFAVLNTSKKNYKAAMAEQVLSLPKMKQVAITYTLYPASNRRTDTSNVLSIHDKYFCDALVELKRLPDDDYEHVISTSYRFGEVDKDNGRVEIEIMEINNG